MHRKTVYTKINNYTHLQELTGRKRERVLSLSFAQLCTCLLFNLYDINFYDTYYSWSVHKFNNRDECKEKQRRALFLFIFSIAKKPNLQFSIYQTIACKQPCSFIELQHVLYYKFYLSP